MHSSSSKNLLKSTLWIWFLTMLGVRVIHELSRLPIIRDNTLVLTAALLIYVPIGILWKKKEKMPFLESNLEQFLRSVLIFILVSVAIFPILEIGNRYFQQIIFGAKYVGGNYSGLAKTALIHLTLVALPEEFFYRGFLQTRLNQIWGRPWKFLGARFGKGLFLTCFLFALAHSLIQLQWWHFAIFFPSLVFSWLRERTGAITASVLFHALANIYSYWVYLNYK